MLATPELAPVSRHAIASYWVETFIPTGQQLGAQTGCCAPARCCAVLSVPLPFLKLAPSQLGELCTLSNCTARAWPAEGLRQESKEARGAEFQTRPQGSV